MEVGGEVVLCRRDKGNRIRARVIYYRYDADGRREIGVELLDKADFWDLEKRIQTPWLSAPQVTCSVKSRTTSDGPTGVGYVLPSCAISTNAGN